jgi:hypothetical protein
MLEVLSVKAVSQTGILLTFSDTVVLGAADVNKAFSITDGSGSALRIVKIRITGPEVLLDTALQARGEVYEVRIGDVVRGKSTSSGKAIALNMEKSTILVMSFERGKVSPAPKPTSPPSPTPSSKPKGKQPADVYGLRLAVEEDVVGSFTVRAEWKEPVENSALIAFRIQQTFDKGRTYGTPQTVERSMRNVQFVGIKAGSFGILVQSVGPDGALSKGVTSFVTLRPGVVPRGGLSNSGPGVLLALVGAGTVAGWIRGRRKPN